jgi:RecB family exonuclease
MRLVPTQTHLDSALAAGESGATLRGSQRDLLSALARPGDARLGSLTAMRAAARAALEEAEASGVREPALPEEPAARVALAHAVDQALGRLRRGGASSADLRSVGSARAARLAALLDAVDVSLRGAGLLDPRAAGAELARRLRRADAATHAELVEGDVHIEGTLGWEADDLAWVEALHGAALARGGRGVTVHLPRLGASLGGDDEDEVAPIADALERRWASLSDAPDIAWDAPLETAQPTAAIEATTRDGEARAVTRVLLEALAGGAAPETLVVLVPDLDESALEPLRAALDAAAVPFAEPRGRPATGSPEARAAMALLALAEGPVTRDLLIEVLRAPGVHAGWWTETASEAGAAARAALLAHRLRDVPVAVDRGGRLFVDAVTRLAATRPSEAWMARALERLLGSTGWLAAASSRADLGARFLSLVDVLRLGRPSAGELGAALRAEEAAAASRGRAAASATPALTALGSGAAAVRALREAVAEVMEAAEVTGLSAARGTPAELGIEIERALAAGAGTQGAAARAGAVRIARTHELGGVGCELLVVTGLEARAYGGTHPAGDALLDEATAHALPVPSRPASAAERAGWRRAELAWAVAGARRLVLTTAPAREGHALPLHPFFTRAARALGARREPAARVVAAASRLSTRDTELCRLAAGGVPAADIAGRVAAERERARFFLDPRLGPGAHSGRIEPRDDADRAHLLACVGGSSAEHTLGVTHIEGAARCAFAGFARRVLKTRRAEDLGEAADPRERGNLVHRALRAAFEAAAPLAHGDLRGAVAAGHAAALTALGARERGAPLRREAAEQAADEAALVLAQTLHGGEPVRFALAEQRFGPGMAAPWSALELRGDGAPSVFIDGQIDRVDRSSDGRVARVVDYKTGKPAGAAEHGVTALQLPLYAEAVARALGAPALEAIYLRVRQGGAVETSPRKTTEQVMSAELRATAIESARRAVLRMWAGEVAPRPLKASQCMRCDARDVCRRPAVMPVDDDEERS